MSKIKKLWNIIRKKPYTEEGIAKKECIRCGKPAEHQWQICADDNNYRPICKKCDFKLNVLVLKFMDHPKRKSLLTRYFKKLFSSKGK